MLGTRLANRYTILKTLGSGGFGQTYLARDEKSSTEAGFLCVVKQLKPASRDLTFLKVARRLFETEVKTLQRLGQHDRIPQLLDSFEDGEEFYLVQEFIEGIPLSEELKVRDRLSETEVIALLEDVLPLIQFVHDNNVIHRDIKPGNLIRRHRDGKIVLIDFGAVKEIRTQLLSGEDSTLTVGIGTHGYTPPEQLTGKPRFGSDLYALGMTAIQALTGLSPGQMIEDPQTSEIIWQFQADASTGLKLVLSKLVRHSYYYRYQTVADVLHDLDRLEQLSQDFSDIKDFTVPWDISTLTPRKRRLRLLRDLAIATVATAGLVLGIRQMGGFQAVELKLYDTLVHRQALPEPDSRLLIVEITEADLRQQQRATPNDAAIAQAIQTLQTFTPRVIGLDLHREIPQPPGHDALIEALQADNTIVITKLGNTPEETIPPPASVPLARVGFNDFPADPDNVIRRNLLFSSVDNQAESEVLPSFALQLVLKYLAADGVTSQASEQNADYMKLGESVFPMLTANAGNYRHIDTRGYQIMLDYHSPAQVARRVSLSDVLAGNLDANWVEDKIVLIGMTASSGRDLFYTPYSAQLSDEHQMPGVVIHANMVHQILSVALGEQALPWFWPEWAEMAWIVSWAVIGAALSWRVRQPLWLGMSIVGGGGVIVIVAVFCLSQGGWIPIVAPVTAIWLAGAAVLAQRVYRPEVEPQALSTFWGQATVPYPNTQLDQ